MAVFRKDSNNAVAAVYSAPRALTAAASQVKMNDKSEAELFKSRRNATSAQWQQEAWEYYDAIGEIKYAFNLVGSVVSRIRLYAAIIEDPSEAPTPVGDSDKIDPQLADAAKRALARLDSAYGGQAGLLKDAALNLSVVGECYLVQMPERIGTGSPESWDIRSTDELTVNDRGQYLITPRQSNGTSAFQVALPQDAFIGRIWRSHPRWSDESDSSLKGLLDLCAELLLLNRTFRATARSRLNAGALYLPDGLSLSAGADPDFPYSEDGEASGNITAEEEEDEFEEQLIDAMTTPISDESSASAVVPLIIRGPAELGDKIKQFKFERSFDPALAERSDRVLDRIMQGLDVPKDVVTGLANVKYCLTPDTEIYTKRGWLTYDQIQEDDVAYTLNHETGLGQWQSISAINVFSYDSAVDGKMLSIETASHSSLSTPNHRWPIIKTSTVKAGTARRFTTSDKLTSADRIPLSAQVDARTLPAGGHGDYRDEFAELIGWYVTEGCYFPAFTGRRARPYATLSQSMDANPTKVARIIRLLTALFGPEDGHPFSEDIPTWRSYTHKGRVEFHINPVASEAIFDVAPGVSKAITLDFIHDLSYRQLELFTQAAMEGDGSYYKDKQGLSSDGVHSGIFWQKSEVIFTAVEAALILTGKPITNYLSAKLGFGLRIKERYNFQPRRRPENITKLDYIGNVWCPTTENTTWMARRNGTIYFTGNSNALQIDESLYKAHIEPLMLLISDALTIVYMRPYLRSLGYSEADISRVVIWYDPSAIATRNDRATDADSGFEKMAISYDAWRHAHGFSDSDAPSPEELALRMMAERGVITPELTEALLTSIAPNLLKNARAASQAASIAPMPPEVQQALSGEAPPTETAPAESTPTPEAAAPEAAPPIALAEPTA